MRTEVFTPAELAKAAGVPRERVESMIAAGSIGTLDGSHISAREAVRAGRLLRVRSAEGFGGAAVGHEERPLLTLLTVPSRKTGMPLALSSAAHAAAIGLTVLITGTLTSTHAVTETSVATPEPIRMVYLMTPGPGGGGGGGGRRQPAPPPKAERAGRAAMSSPIPKREAPRPIEPEPAPEEPEPPPLEAEPVPPIIAAVVPVPGDERDRAGVMEESDSVADSRGPGEGGGVGSGEGTGLGEGEGPGIGPGSGGGTGGGPYRPGSGIAPPRLLREVKPDYTETARRQGIEGDVVMEIVVRSDGTVGNVRVIQSLASDLDQRAIAAVRQWRFSPATRFGQPVDVIVEVAVEFKLR